MRSVAGTIITTELNTKCGHACHVSKFCFVNNPRVFLFWGCIVLQVSSASITNVLGPELTKEAVQNIASSVSDA